MSAKANFFKIGLFTIGATIALIVLLVILGSGRLFQSKVLMETYVNESVQGLEVGAPVDVEGPRGSFTARTQSSMRVPRESSRTTISTEGCFCARALAKASPKKRGL